MNSQQRFRVDLTGPNALPKMTDSNKNQTDGVMQSWANYRELPMQVYDDAKGMRFLNTISLDVAADLVKGFSTTDTFHATTYKGVKVKLANVTFKPKNEKWVTIRGEVETDGNFDPLPEYIVALI